VSEHLDSASKTSPKWLNRRPKVLRKRAQRQFTTKGTLSCSLPLLKPRLSRDSLGDVSIGIAFQQQAANQLGGDQIRGAGEECLGKVLGGAGRAW